jgi:hypothetical protein
MRLQASPLAFPEFPYWHKASSGDNLGWHLGSSLGLQFLVSESIVPFSKASKSKALVMVGVDKRVPAAMAPKLLRKFLRLDDSAIKLVDGLVARLDGDDVVNATATAIDDRIRAWARRLVCIIVGIRNLGKERGTRGDKRLETRKLPVMTY